MEEWTIRDVRELLWELNERAKKLDWNSEKQMYAFYGNVIFLNAIIHARWLELLEKNDD